MPVHPATDRTVERLLEGIHAGEFAIPLFQRGFEWTPNKVRDLLTSIIEKYFSGLLLFWELDHSKVNENELQPLWGTGFKNGVNFAILDGQQRLSSLYYALYNPNVLFPNKQSYYLFFLDLNKCIEGNLEESILYVYSARHTSIQSLKEQKDNFVRTGKLPLALLSDRDFRQHELGKWIKEFVKSVLSTSKTDSSSTSDKEFDRIYDTVTEIQDYLTGILSYEYTTHVLSKNNDTKDVCLMFARLNQKGLKLSMFDLMNAFLYRKEVQLRKSYEEDVNEELKKIPDFEEYLLKSLALYKRGYSSPRYVYSLVPGYVDVQKVNGKQEKVISVKDPAEFKKLWRDLIHFSESARRKIQNVCDKCFGAVKVDYIPNSTMIPVLAAILKEYHEKHSTLLVENKFDKVITKWYWSAVISQDYSGSSDSVMSKDYRELKEWVSTGDSNHIERISGDRPKIILDSVKLASEKKGTSVYNAVISLIALNKAEDFFERIVPGSGDYKSSAINDHHIFPSKVRGLDQSKSKSFSKTKDTILNRTLLLDSTNIKINNVKPSLYLSKILSEKLGSDEMRLSKLMESHLISEEALKHLWNDEYDEFIKVRESTIREALKKYILG